MDIKAFLSNCKALYKVDKPIVDVFTNILLHGTGLSGDDEKYKKCNEELAKAASIADEHNPVATHEALMKRLKVYCYSLIGNVKHHSFNATVNAGECFTYGYDYMRGVLIK